MGLSGGLVRDAAAGGIHGVVFQEKALVLRGGEGDKMKTQHVLILVLAALAVIFVLQNSAIVTIRLFFWSISMNRIIMIAGLMVVGFVIGYVLARR
jgi:uncharacterized integral membrane protein